MDLADRYVEAVKRYLPAKQREDIGAELYSTIEEKLIETKRAEGREPTEAEVLQLLKEQGHPLRVASAYRVHRPIISEALIPIYTLVLTWIFVALFSLWTIRTVIVSSRILDKNPDWLDIDFFMMGAIYFGIVTAVFVLCDQYLSRIDFFGKWNPSSLPPMTAYIARIPISSSVSGIVFTQIWLVALTAIRNEYSWSLLFGTAGSLAGSIILWLKIHAVCVIGLHLVNVFQPYWTSLKSGIDAVLSFGLAGMLLYPLLLPEPARVLIESLAQEQVPEGDAQKLMLLDTAIRTSIGSAALIILGFAGYSVYRAFDLRRD